MSGEWCQSVDACVCVFLCVCMYVLVLDLGGLLELRLEAESPTQSGQTLAQPRLGGACICGRKKGSQLSFIVLN